MTKKIISQCVLCILSATTGLHAITWSAAVDGNWNTSANWTDGAVPTASDEAKINKAANVTISATADANNLLTGNNSTVTVSSGGSLTVATDADVGNLGSEAYGTVVVDGGTLTIADRLFLGRYDDTRTGTLQLNSGNITVGANRGTIADTTDNDGDGQPDDPTLEYTSKVVQIGGNNLGTGVVTIAGGNFTVYGQFWVGSAGAGTLNLSGGTLDISAGNWQNLRVGHQAGNGTVNMTGGTLVTTGIVMDNNAAGNANINLDGGTLQVVGGFTNALKMSDNSELAISDGVLQWQGNMTTNIDTLITNGNITFANSTTSGNYPGVTPVQSWNSSDGAVTLYADYDGLKTGYTTVWAESNDTDGDGYNNSVDVFPDDVNEWADTDGDNVGDNADVHDGYNDAELSLYLTNNNYIIDDGNSGGLSEQDLIDLRVGSKLASIANDQATLQVVIEQSDDLGSWSTLKTEDVTVDAPVGTAKQFFRYRMQD